MRFPILFRQQTKGKNARGEAGLDLTSPSRRVLLPGDEGQPPEQQSIDPYALRRQCRSPSNRPDELPDGLAPLDFVPMGNYAVSVRWNDGHQSFILHIPYASFVEGWAKG